MKQSIPSVETWVSNAPKPRIGNFYLGMTQAVQERWLVMSLILTDIALIGAAFRLAFWIRFQLELPIFKLDVPPRLVFYEGFSLASIPIWIILFAVFGLYTRDNLLGGTKEYDLIFRATTFIMFLTVIGGFLDVFVLSRGWLVVAWLCVLILLTSGRFLVRRMVYRLREKGFFLTPALIIGANAEGHALGEQLYRWKRSGLHLIGYVDEHSTPGSRVYRDLRVLGDLASLGEIVARYRVGELILATSSLDRNEMLDIFQEHGISSDVNLRMSSGLFEIITTGLQVKELAYVPLVRVNKVRLTGADEIGKLLLDIGLTIPLLLLFLPLFVLVAILVKLDSRGPILHRRRVMGLNGTEFDAYKFRTMFVNGEQILDVCPDLKVELEHNHKLKDDPRITRIGKILRKFSIDELPQLFNVLRRQMSLVGPRMISPPEMAQYSKWGINLLTVRPGMTGLWQVSGRSNLSYERRVRLDMYYIRNWSIWLDLYLLLQTPLAVFRSTGAY